MNFPTDRFCFLKAFATSAAPLIEMALFINDLDEQRSGDYRERLEQALPILINVTSTLPVVRNYFKETARNRLEPCLLFAHGDPFFELKKNSLWQKKLVDFLLIM